MRTPPSTATRRIPCSLMMACSLPRRSRRRLRRRAAALLQATIMQRPAAERRKSGAEDHPGINVIGVGDNAVGKGALALVEHRLDQLSTETIALPRVVRPIPRRGLALL